MRYALVAAFALLASSAWAQLTTMGIGGGGGGVFNGPSVIAVTPNTGPTAGGTPVVISGTNFTGVTAVSFGGTPAASFMFINGTTIDATSPAGSSGVVDVRVTTPVGTSGINVGDRFTYGTVCSNSMDFSQPCNTQYGF